MLDELIYECDRCGHERMIRDMIGFVCGCGGTFRVINMSLSGRVNWGNPIKKGGDRKGYHPEYDDPVTEIKADFECLKEKQMHTKDMRTDGKLRKTLHGLKNIYKDVLT